MIKYLFVLLLLLSNLAICQSKKKKIRLKTKSADTLQKPKPIAVKLMSFNIGHGIDNKGQTNLLRIVELIKQCQPDLVAIQDCDSGAVRSGKLNQLKIISLLTGYEYWFAGITDLNPGKNGLGILSARPLENSLIRPLPNPENKEPRFLMSALITLSEGRYLHIANTQLEPLSPMNRGLQAAVASEFLKNSIYPVILAGDFNAVASDHTLESLTKAWDDVGQNDPTPTHLPSQQRLDYFWLQKNSLWKIVSYQVLPEPVTATHQPILATFEW